MNLKLNNEVRNADDLRKKRSSLSVKEERQRTGRYIAILVGILLFLLAIYHAWVRNIPFIASLIVPAIIMFIYVGWVLYTASRDKHRALDAEAALNAAMAAEEAENAANAFDISIIANVKNTPEDIQKELAEISSAIVKGSPKNEDNTIKLVNPIILVNDEPPDDLEQVVVQAMAIDTSALSKFKVLPTRRKLKRKFCRSKRNAAFKRSYSIA